MGKFLYVLGSNSSCSTLSDDRGTNSDSPKALTKLFVLMSLYKLSFNI